VRDRAEYQLLETVCSDLVEGFIQVSVDVEGGLVSHARILAEP
jgi:hypothetical protein